MIAALLAALCTSMSACTAPPRSRVQVSVPVNHHLVDSLVSEGTPCSPQPKAIMPRGQGQAARTAITGPGGPGAGGRRAVAADAKPSTISALTSARGGGGSGGGAGEGGEGGGTDATGVCVLPDARPPAAVMEAVRELFDGVIDTDPCRPVGPAAQAQVRA